MSRRIQRGFHRVGIGAAVLVAIAGLVLTGLDAVNTYKSSDRLGDKIARNDATGELRRGNWVLDHKVRSVGKPGVVDIDDLYVTVTPDGFKIVEHPDWRQQILTSPATHAALVVLLDLVIAALAAVAAFGLFRGIGWVVVGFGKDAS